MSTISRSLAAFALITFTAIRLYGADSSRQWVHLNDQGQLVYAADERGNRIPDFSYVGYHAGEKAIPNAPVVLTIRPDGDDIDDTERIQQAIDEVGRKMADKKEHGALLLKRGIYRVGGTLALQQSYVVLRGEGSDENGTVVVATGYGDPKYKRALIQVGNYGRIKLRKESKRSITDSYVPIGARKFQVESSEGYRVGDRIVVYMPLTAKWIAAIGCDRLSPKWNKLARSRWVKDGKAPGFYYRREETDEEKCFPKRKDESWDAFRSRVPLSKDGKKLDSTVQWQPDGYRFYFERKITAIEGKTIFIDAPIVHPLDRKFGAYAIYQYDSPERVYEVGIENIRLMSEFAEPTRTNPYGNPAKMKSAEQHAWNAIRLARNSEHCWVRNVQANYFGWSLVSASGKHATIQDCINLGHASKIVGGRRYPFMISGQLNLVQRCLALQGRHEFVNQAKTAGPNVFVDCLGRDTKSNAGPHHRYAIGNLYDCVKSERFMESRFRDNSGSGHGWAGVQTCFYNCVAPQFKVEAPAGTYSWVLGSGPESEAAARRLHPNSLYYQQVRERLGDQALRRLGVSSIDAIGSYSWAKSPRQQ